VRYRSALSRTTSGPTALALTGLALSTLLLPVLGQGGFSLWAQISVYVFTLACVGLFFHGLLSLWEDLPTPAMLALGAAAAVPGMLAAYFSRPEILAEGAGALTLLALLLANICRLLAACAIACALARHITSAGVALLIAGVATFSDLFSVFAGPTRTLVREDSPALDFLLLIFPTFGQPAGFALGISDFIFLALFAATAHLLGLRYLLTLAAGFTATLLAMICGLILERPLPALPFIALSFVLVNITPLLSTLRKAH